MQIIMGTVSPLMPCSSIRLRTTAASGVSGLMRPAMAPISPMIEVMMGLMPAESDSGIAMTGIMARQGIEPGPAALSTMPRKNITTGMARAGTRLTTFLAKSSSVPLL